MELYEPYNLDSFKKLLHYAHSLGWYSGKRTLFNLKCEGSFEGWTGRATEDWEQRFTLTSEEILLQNGKKIPALDIVGKSVKEVCEQALVALGEIAMLV